MNPGQKLMEKILVAEDEFEIRTGIKYLLTEEGFEVTEAEDGRRALEILNKQKVDLIISDIMMPNMSGYDLLNEIQKNDSLSSIPFLFLTAKSANDDFRKGMGLGASDYITKPFKALDLLQAIEVRLRKKSELEERFEKLKSVITKYVPHELRTPLVAIIGFSDLILNDYKGSSNEIMEMVERINVAGNRLLRTIEKFIVITELKSLSNSISSNIKKYEATDFSIIKVIENVQERLYKIYNNYVQIEDKVIEERINITDSHFQIMITELLDNAIKFSAPYETVNIRTKVDEDFYIIEIINIGKEFTEEQIKKVSEFVQFDREEFQQNGNGLGLSIVKGILNIIKGTLEISSRNGLSKVIVKIPLLRD